MRPVTPSARHFVRTNGLVPERARQQDLQGWTLNIDDEGHQPLNLSMAEEK
jgi:DMSO/TMAO reductase YedYZ molybdopterin-dependent catalytic subunit